MIIALALLGCTTSEPTVTDDTAAEEAVFTPPEAPDNGVQVVIDGFTVEPYTELELCRYIKTDNAVAGQVVRMELVGRDGLHHAFVTKSSQDLSDGEEACFGLPDAAMQDYSDVPEPLFASSTQVSTETVAFPEGVGVTLDANQQLIFNYHYLNVTGDPIDGEVYLNLYFSDDGAEIKPANLFVFGNMSSIDLPPGETTSLTSTCAFDEDTNLFSVTPHMHALGSGFSFTRDATDEVLLQTEGWSNPETLYLDPTISVSAGETFSFTCQWTNITDEEVGFGQTSADEMCFVFGYHWPATDMYWRSEYNGCTVQ